MNQKQFAAMVGVSLPLVKMVETGQQPLAESFARKIHIATGAVLSFPDLSGNRLHWKPFSNGKVRYLPQGEGMADALIASKKELGWEYTKEHFDWHREFFQSSPKAAELAMKEIVPALQELFLTAAKPGVAGLKHRLPAIRASLWDWMAETNKAFRLGLKLLR
jgi:hypothetical protein